VLKPYTFANGITVPTGATLAIPTFPTNMDESIYENPSVFDGFRLHRLRHKEWGNHKYYAVNTSNEFVNWGIGQHAWYNFVGSCTDYSPGRFFAVNEVKLMLAFTLLKSDFKTKDGKRPGDSQFETYIIPDMKAEILFKRRS
jgi:cytochrome P450